MAPKSHPFHLDAESLLAPFSRSFPKTDLLMHFGRPLAHFWLPFGSHWLPFGSRRLTFGSLWLIFGSLWLPFGSLLVSLGSLLVPFASLLLTRGSIFSLLLYPGLIFHIFIYFQRKCKGKSFYNVLFIKSYIFGQPNRTFPKCAERTPTEKTSSFVTYPQGPGAEHLPLAT